MEQTDCEEEVRLLWQASQHGRPQEQDCHQAEDYGVCEDECHRLPLGMLQAGCQQGKPVDIFGGEMRW